MFFVFLFACVAAQRTALWVTTGGALTRDRSIRLEYPTNTPNQTVESLCYIESLGLPREQTPDANGAYPLLCVANSPMQMAPPVAFIDTFESAGGRALPFFSTRFSGWRARVSRGLLTVQCALATGDRICAQEFGDEFQLATASRGFWAYCGATPEPSGTRVLLRIDPPPTPSSAGNGTVMCGTPVERMVPSDECWNDNPCVDPLECFDELKTQSSSAICGTKGATTDYRTSFFNQCVRLLGNDFCVDVYSGNSSANATDDGACAFGARVSRNAETVFERSIDLGVVPYACARFQNDQLPGAQCETCVELRDVKHYAIDNTTGQPTSARGCVELALSCNDIPLARAQLGCLNSTALTRCEQSLERRDNSSIGRADPPNSRCVRPTPLSPRLCLQLNTSDSCDITASILADNSSIFSRVFDAADLLSVSNRSDALATALLPRTFCVNDARLPCSTCIDWRPSYKHANDTPDPNDKGLVSWSACASVNVTCLEEDIVQTDLGCFDEQPIPSRCFDACTKNEDCGGHGSCNRGLCNCDATWHGAKCSYQCPGDCSGATRGVCLPTGVCACIPPATGMNCSRNLLGISFGPAPTRRPNMNPVDNNPGDRIPATLTNCPSDCNRQGDCVRGNCTCYDGFDGAACEQEISSVLSGGAIALIVLMVVVALLVLGVVVYASRAIITRESSGEAGFVRLNEDDHDHDAAGAAKSLASNGNSSTPANDDDAAEMTATAKKSKKSKKSATPSE